MIQTKRKNRVVTPKMMTMKVPEVPFSMMFNRKS